MCHDRGCLCPQAMWIVPHFLARVGVPNSAGKGSFHPEADNSTDEGIELRPRVPWLRLILTAIRQLDFRDGNLGMNDF